MEYDKIKFLLEKYFDGETSLPEEKLLSEYFAQPNIHADFEEYKPLFDYFSETKNIASGKNFDKEILPEIKEEKKSAKSVKMYWLRVAAVVLLMIGAAGIIYKTIYPTNKNQAIQTATKVQPDNANQIEIADTYDNPEDAKKAVEHALALLSQKMNKGKNMAEKNIAKMDVLNKAIDTN